eukprot:TRINITY_DN1116_c3_g1_i3.p1 TRINITY_DN1116_c3_g1~~TRINITY_DN1116_c3_g1_i3.p1  ORF type:complete len:793 (-),score=443.56 TRINITY_DN1116_c3_g1_i3:88-2466(-)
MSRCTRLVAVLLCAMLSLSHALATRDRVASATLHARLSDSTRGLARVARLVTAARDRADTDLWHPRGADGSSLLHAGAAVDIFDERNHAPMLEFVQTLARSTRTGGDDEEPQSLWDRATGYVGDKWDQASGAALKTAERALTSVRSRVRSVSAGDVVGAVLFGLVNGVLLGLAGSVREDFRRAKTECREGADQVQASFAQVSSAVSDFASGVIDSESEERGGAGLKEFVMSSSSTFLQAVGGLFGNANEYVQTCQPLRRTIGMVFMLVLVGIVFTLLLLAFPVIGWIVKIAGALLTLIFAGAFALETARKLGRALGDNSRTGTIALIEATAEFAGILIAVFVLSGIQGIAKDASIASKFNGSALARRFNLRFSSKTTAEVAALESAVNTAKAGQATALTKLTSAGKTAQGTSATTTATTTATTATTTTTTAKAAKAASEGAKIVDDVARPNAGAAAAKSSAKTPDVRASYDKSAHRWRNEANGQFHKTPGGLKWDAKVNRWRGKDGRFAKQPDNVWPKWDANVQRWRDHLGRFSKSPIDDTMRWEKNTQRFREIDTGRFAKNPSENHAFYVLERGSGRAMPIKQAGPTVIVPVNPAAPQAATKLQAVAVIGAHRLVEGQEEAEVDTQPATEAEVERSAEEGSEAATPERRAGPIVVPPAAEDDARDGTNIHFAFDSSCGPEIASAARAAIARYSGAETLFVAGHTDAVGAEGYNFALSQRRAVNAAGALRAAGFEGRLEIAWYGESRVEAAKGSAYNRRVVIAGAKPEGWLEAGLEVPAGEGVDGATACASE